jgi:hypothetical protein
MSELALLEELGQRLESGCGEELRKRLVAALLRVRDKQGRLVPLEPNAAQSEFSNRCSRRNIVLKARQLGITTWVAARFFINTITRPGMVTVQVAHDQDSAEEIFRIVHRFQENLPEALRQGVLKTSRANVRQLVFPQLDSEYRVETAADPHAGRGLTIRNLHCSEVARWPGDAAETLASLRAAVPPDGEVVLESTPNGAAGCFYDEWQRADETGHMRHFFPWWIEPRYAVPGVTIAEMSDEERELVERFELSDAQIAFRRDVRANFRQRAKEEYAEDANSCFLASGECVFDVETIARRMSDAGEAVESRDNGRLLVWLPARKNAEYVIGVDPAGGGAEGDFACAQVIERTTGLPCAELVGHLPPQQLASAVASLGHEYNEALVAVERNNHGHAVLAYLGMEPYPNVYEQQGKAGWLTSSLSRPKMLEDFAALLNTTPELVQSGRLLQQCRTFVRRADGSAGAASGAHDDCVMAVAIAQAVRTALPNAAPPLRAVRHLRESNLAG